MAADNPNRDVIAGLREVADFLAAHPELPKACYALVSLRSQYDGWGTPPARETLTALAVALGDRATERGGGAPLIDGRFSGDVRVCAEAKVSELRDEPVAPVEYEPIIPVKS